MATMDDLLDILYNEPAGLMLRDALPGSADVGVKAAVRSPAAAGKKTVEPVGEAYHAAQLRFLGAPAAVAKKARAAVASGSEESESEAFDMERLLQVDFDSYYDLLGLEALNVNATDEQIRRAYRSIVVHLHPDKARQAAEAKAAVAKIADSAAAIAKALARAEKLYLVVQKAYDALSNGDKRRSYDSRYEFDENIPAANDKSEFFALYKPVFERNSRFSIKQPVPKVGDMETDLKEVEEFYAFWFAFDSWREFSGGEHDPNDAEARDEKRWMERQNKREAQKLKKEETTRVADLVTRAYARDPRILAKKNSADSEKKRAWEKKKLFEKMVAEQGKRKEVELVDMAACDAESVKLRKGFREKAKRTDKRSLKEVKEVKDLKWSEADFEWILTRCTATALHAIAFGPGRTRDLPANSSEPAPKAVDGAAAALIELMAAEKGKAGKK